uniref:hypothetical protein n=1 Tax=Pedobacter schmidteae TaxID=2201271 RepID=UPI000EAC9BD5|nr:hypothetical protein [Pedobacter schmidteae]
MRKYLLLLDLYLMKNREVSLVLKSGYTSARIERFCNALQFVGRMKQLSKAIDTGANQDCAYELRNFKGLEWILACRFAKGVVALELWFEQLGFCEKLEMPFDWKGSAQEFRDAVDRMIRRLPKFF